MKNLLVSLFDWTIRALTVFVGFPLLWAIEPFWRIRIDNVHEDRIGHLALDTEVYVRDMKSKGMPPRTTHILLAHRPANRQLLKMWKRHLPIIESYILRRASMAFLPILKKTRFAINHRTHPDGSDALSAGEPTLHFTDEEEEKGKTALLEMGIGPDDWFVCFHARSPLYLSARITAGRSGYNPSNRDCSFENYIPAMGWIAEQGGFALRVGSHPEQPLPDIDPRVIDYSTHYRTDFMDIYLSAKCRFMLGSDSGLSCVPQIFCVPSAMANFVSMTTPGLGTRMLLIPKLLRNVVDGKILTFPECHRLGMFDNSTPENRILIRGNKFYEDRNLEWIENSPEEVLELCCDMMDRVENRPPPQADEVARLQAAYKAFHSATHATPIGPRFALRHKDLVTGNA